MSQLVFAMLAFCFMAVLMAGGAYYIDPHALAVIDLKNSTVAGFTQLTTGYRMHVINHRRAIDVDDLATPDVVEWHPQIRSLTPLPQRPGDGGLDWSFGRPDLRPTGSPDGIADGDYFCLSGIVDEHEYRALALAAIGHDHDTDGIADTPPLLPPGMTVLSDLECGIYQDVDPGGVDLAGTWPKQVYLTVWVVKNGP